MSEGHIEVKGLRKEYGELIAVDGIDFTVRKGQVFSLLGPNGAGKTTTVEILECLRTPSAGEVRILGMGLEQSSKIKRRVGVLPQGFNAFDRLTVKENVDYFAGMFDDPVDTEELLRWVKLEKRKKELFKNLSGGMKQRVGIAMSLVNDPEIVFLDEPTTGLDPGARRDVWRMVQGLRDQGKTVLLTTHYMEEAEALSDYICIMNKGRIICRGTPREIINEHGADPVAIVKAAGDKGLEALIGRFPDCSLMEDDLKVPIHNSRRIADILNILDDAEVHYDEVIIKKSTLEDVFLKLTGEELRGGEEDEE